MPTTAPLRIVLVDDHEMVRHGRKTMLTPFRERVEVVGAADGAADCVRVVAQVRPDIVLCDVRMRGSSGLRGTDVTSMASVPMACDPAGLVGVRNVHTAATAVHVVFAVTDGTAELRVADDGRGFEPGEDGDGYGLRSMAERIELVGGTLQVASRPAVGTTVTARVPLPPQVRGGERCPD